jgi:Phosphoesterase family
VQSRVTPCRRCRKAEARARSASLAGREHCQRTRGNSNPLDEQTLIADTLNRLQELPEWRHMAVIIVAEDSDGWHDHVMRPIVNQSNTTLAVPCCSND